MGKFQGKLVAFLFFVAIAVGIFGACNNMPQKTGTLMDFVPERASVVFKITNWQTLQADIKGSSLLSKFEKTAPYLFFSEKNPLLKNLHPNAQSLLCVNQLNDSLSAYTFISKQTEHLFQLDSIKNKTVETLKIDGQSFHRITLEDRPANGKEIAYAATIDSVLVVTSSQQIMQDILNGKTERGETFKKVFNLPTSHEFTVLLRGNKVAVNDSTKIDFTSWSALDVTVAPESLFATGITLATDSIPQLLNVFEGQIPQQHHISEIVPMNALGAISFTFNDAEKFQKKLRLFRNEKENTSVQTTGIFGSASEVGAIELTNETAIFIKSIDASLTADALARFVSEKSKFREIGISSFSEPALFQKTFSPFVNSEDANFVFQLDDFFVFTKTESAAAEIIGAFQNNATLKNTSYFEKTASGLSTASSLLILKMQGEFSEAIAGFFNAKSRAEIKALSFGKFPLAALQFSFDRNFAHVTLSCREIGGATKNSSGKVSEKFNTSLENAVLGSPQLFGNGGGSNVVVQDIGNKLYLISENGKVLWTKNLGDAILGKIEMIDIYGNGNKQMAFATKNTLYILDRNGNNVKGFPLKFKDDVTRPLAVFDYDGNHNYRFVIVQGKEVLMYDKAGKTVKGFGFNSTKSNIIHPPKHIRMGNKDYIVIAEENGTLHILSRVGRTRIPVAKKFDFSEVPIAEEDNTFVVITEENAKVRIGQNGKITSQKLDVGSNYWFATQGSTKVTVDGNLLRINGKLAQLPLGVYSKPQLFILNRKSFITITETQENKVYVFDGNANVLNGFPVYGSSEASLDGNGKNAINLVAKGETNGVILYSGN